MHEEGLLLDEVENDAAGENIAETSTTQDNHAGPGVAGAETMDMQ